MSREDLEDSEDKRSDWKVIKDLVGIYHPHPYIIPLSHPYAMQIASLVILVTLHPSNKPLYIGFVP